MTLIGRRVVFAQVYGELIGGEEHEDRKEFLFSHSIAPLWTISAPYSPSREFLFFKDYDVGARKKVALISAQHG